MKRMHLAAALAALLLVSGCTAANADDTAKTTAPAYGPGWRHEQMVQARTQGTLPPAMMAARGPGMGMGMMMGRGLGGPPLKADGTIDTAKLPDGCPLKVATPTQ